MDVIMNKPTGMDVIMNKPTGMDVIMNKPTGTDLDASAIQWVESILHVYEHNMKCQTDFKTI